ncbi:hypothetical protein [Paenibacillus rhizophilus]|uniref:hypothetical protein n=1 Tax=Paenibacillus rhizophilus TaxID=1850366 RepID=UPI00163AF859|nr:hypothetical protein [Paenibacillus rhizophilus]
MQNSPFSRDKRILHLNRIVPNDEETAAPSRSQYIVILNKKDRNDESLGLI